MKKFFYFFILLLGVSQFAIAEPNIQWGVTIASGGMPPPAVRYEPLPSPRPSQVWVRGYWAWDGNDYRWVAGHWERARSGYVYVQPEWVEGPRGWEFRRGGWEGGGRRERDDSPKPGHCPPGHRKKGES